MQAYTLDTAWRAWIDRRFPVLFKASLPSNLLLFLLPAGIVGLTSHGRWVALVVFPLFVAFYALNIMFGSVYAVLLVVTMLPLAIMGARRIERGIEGAIPILARRTRPVLTMLLLGISLAALPQFNPATEQYAAPTLQAVEHSLHSIEGRALVFFRYRTGQNVHEEPVYNIEGAEIDAQRIVRAHDLGSSENLKLIRYYADRQPDRRAYLFDRGSRTLTLLGPVTQLAAQSAVPQPEVPIPSAR